MGLAAAHAAPLTAIVAGTRRQDWIAFFVFYAVNLFAVGGALHRYFAHRAFKTSRVFQFLLALLGSVAFGTAVGFAGKHRMHHRYSDTERDVHSPQQGGLWCWFGHLVEDGYREEEILEAARDLARYPELMWLHRHCFVPGLAAAGLVWLLGGYSMFAVGFCLSWCLAAIHGPAAVNYFCHVGKSRRFETPDRSSNSLFLAIVLLGEGWHNNHHHYPSAARSGFAWYEVDVLYYIFKMLSWVGIIWDLREAPAAVRRPATAARGESCALP